MVLPLYNTILTTHYAAYSEGGYSRSLAGFSARGQTCVLKRHKNTHFLLSDLPHEVAHVFVGAYLERVFHLAPEEDCEIFRIHLDQAVWPREPEPVGKHLITVPSTDTVKTSVSFEHLGGPFLADIEQIRTDIGPLLVAPPFCVTPNLEEYAERMEYQPHPGIIPSNHFFGWFLHSLANVDKEESKQSWTM